jgi:ATP-binding cassette, subfamily B, bacterial
MTGSLEALTWPRARLGEAVVALARQAGVGSEPTTALPTTDEDPPALDDESVERRLEAVAATLDLEIEPVEPTVRALDAFLRRAGLALFRLPGQAQTRALALVAARGHALLILGPDGAVHRRPIAVVRAALLRELQAPLAGQIDRLLELAHVAPRRRARVRAAVLDEQLATTRIGGCWQLRPRPGSSLARQFVHAGLLHTLVGFVAAHALHDLLWVLAWWTVGVGALAGRLDRGWLFAWALLLLTLVPLRMLSTWSQGVLAVGAGALLKRRLLAGSLRADPEDVRHQGVGRLLGWVLEAETVEALAHSGGLVAIAAVAELVLALPILAGGAGGLVHVVMLLGWIAVAAGVGARYFRHRERWTTVRFALTEDLVERMIGHRTRLAQEARTRRHDGEDEAVAGYLETSRAMDRSSALLEALVPRGWLAMAVGWLALGSLVGGASTVALAVGLGGALLGYRALQRLVAGVAELVGAAIAWKRLAPLAGAAARPEPLGSVVAIDALQKDPRTRGDDTPVLTAHDLTFRYPDRHRAVLTGVNLRVRTGDRILLVGPSGGGKSTLVSLLTGLRVPLGGLVLLRGLDRQTLGADGWRHRIVAAPQFQENHVLSETLAFNLLLGRRWPPSTDDLEEATALCRDLGLGELLGRMPGGLLQMVGATGWQLSHGERSRLYLARALLQDADVVILDETFAELDPETLRRCLECAVKRAPSLLLIAHV